MAAKGEHGTGQGGSGIQCGPALRINRPARFQRLVCTLAQLDFTARAGAGGKVKHIRLIGIITWKTKTNGIGAKQWLGAARRCHPSMAGGHVQRHQPGAGKLLDLHPQCRKMHTVVNR